VSTSTDERAVTKIRDSINQTIVIFNHVYVYVYIHAYIRIYINMNKYNMYNVYSIYNISIFPS
jgi:hypothetical protein